MRSWSSKTAWLVAASMCLCVGMGCGSESSSSDDDQDEDLSAAWEELVATEGKADGATCSGVRPPDSGPFDNRIALTFDDGPDLVMTPAVLDVLAAHGAKGTFFVNGKRIRTDAYRDLVRRMLAEGHTVANHSQNHEDSKAVSAATWTSEVQQTHDVLTPLLAEAGKVPTFFRFPYGSANCTTYSIVTGFGYHVVGWHIDTADWCFNSSAGGYGYCASSTFQHIPDSYRGDFVGFSVHQATANGGGILLMHDIKRYAVEQLDPLLTALEAAGFAFTTLDDVDTFPLLNGVTPPRDPWIGDPCTDPSECDFMSGDVPGECFTFQTSDTGELAGFCTVPCDGYCPDLDGTAPTFCVASPDPAVGVCASKAWPINESCATIPGTHADEQDRFILSSGASPSTALVCVPR
ncbi:MAG: polysaccharide deacetylase family protein [bacterium]